MNETLYQTELIRKLEREFPGCFVIKNDPSYIQGIPDLLVLYENVWVMLEVKKSRHSPPEPNQRYYVDLFHKMSHAYFIYPENEERVFDELQYAFNSRREACTTQSK